MDTKALTQGFFSDELEPVLDEAAEAIRVDVRQRQAAAPESHARPTESQAVADLEAVEKEAREALAALQVEQARRGAELHYQVAIARQSLTETTLALQRLMHSTSATTATSDSGGEPADDQDQLAGFCPYMGLAAFQAEDAAWFFGREQLVAGLTSRLSETSCLAVVGPSGSGKTSVLHAGLLPAIWGGMLPGAGDWVTVVLTPGAHPMRQLAARLALLGSATPSPLVAGIPVQPEHLRTVVRQALAGSTANAGLVVLVDQFEETFTLCRDEAERRRFVEALVGLTDDSASPVKIVVSIRADFYTRCLDYPELVGLLEDRQAVVGPMGAADLRRVIEDPAARAGLTLEPGLVATILGDLSDEPGSLPLLSHALFATWQHRRDRTLTIAGYHAAGGVRQPIARTADAVFGALDPADQAIAKEVFLRLTALGEGTEDTRRRVRRAELLNGRDDQAVELVLDRLAKARLVTLTEDSVEVAHEVLLREWPTLRRWLSDEREGLRTHRHLTEAAAEWESLGRDPGALYRGVRLAIAREWAKDTEDRLNDLEREFLSASNKRDRDELAAGRRRNRWLVALSAVLVVLLSAAVWQSSLASRQSNLATSRELAAQAVANLDDQPLSLLLSLESLRLAPTDEARASLLQGLLQPRPNATVLTGHTGEVTDVAFSPDGNTIASGGQDGTVRRWITSTGNPVGQPLPLTGHTGPVRSVAFSPDGTTLASASSDGTVRLWDTTTGFPIGQTLTGHTDVVLSVAFSPDGTTLASASTDQTVRLWDVVTGTQIGPPLLGHTGAVEAVAFSPDGRRLASASLDGTVRIWTLAGSEDPTVLRGHDGAVYGVAFSPDGEQLASAGLDGTVRIWTLAGSEDPTVLRGHTDSVQAVAFSPDGRRSASASIDETVRVWPLTGEDAPTVLRGHTGPVEAVAFSPDGTTLASASADQTVRLWDRATGGQQLGQTLTGHTDSVEAVAFSPNGTMLASASYDHTLRLWDTATGQPIGEPLTGHTGPVLGVAFSPDGSILASASADQTVRLWDVVTGTQIGQPLTGHTDTVYAVAFSPDGTTLASASADRTVRLWDPTTGQPLGQPLTGYTGPVYGVAFSLDGTTLASASQDATVRLWDVTTGQPLDPPLTGHTDTVSGVAFSPDGTTLASASADQTVRLWPITLDAWIREACAIANRNLSQDEWNEFVGPSRPYVRTCSDLPPGAGAPTSAPAATYQIN